MLRIHGPLAGAFAIIGGTGAAQILAALIATLLFYLLEDSSAALGAGFGGMVALANTALLGWRTRQVRQSAHFDAEQSLRLLYRASLERFLVAGLLLAVGMRYLSLVPLPLLAGFVLGQVTLIVFQSLCAMNCFHNG